MIRLRLQTLIKAPADRCFDLARSIDFHIKSIPGSDEKAVDGVTSGLLNQGDSVTWRAKHFGKYRFLSSEITKMVKPCYFIDEMVKGDFKKIWHAHIFIECNGMTMMYDDFQYEMPFGIFGRAVSFFYMKQYMRKLLTQRNTILKSVLENKEESKYIKILT
jgi:hypothetical protein